MEVKVGHLGHITDQSVDRKFGLPGGHFEKLATSSWPLISNSGNHYLTYRIWTANTKTCTQTLIHFKNVLNFQHLNVAVTQNLNQEVRMTTQICQLSDKTKTVSVDWLV